MLDFIITQKWSILLFIIIFIIQFIYYLKTRFKLNKCGNIFGKKQIKNPILSQENNSVIIQLGSSDHYKDYKEICEKINKYINHNRDNVSLVEMENITDQECDTIYEDAAANVSLPMYWGLMGTYLGVSLGLFFLIHGGNNDILSNEISIFIWSIIVAMLTSFSGLMFTTFNNCKAAKRYDKLQKYKMKFFTFLQTEVISQLPSTMQDSLAQFRTTLGILNNTVDKLSTDLSETFSDITSKFGENLRESLSMLTNIFQKLENAASSYNAMLTKQDIILNKFASNQFANILSKIDNTVTTCIEAKNSINDMSVSAESLSSSYSNLTDVQKSLIQAQTEMIQMFDGMKDSFFEVQSQATDYFSLLPQKLEDLCERIEEINKSNLNVIDYKIRGHIEKSMNNVIESGNEFVESWKTLFGEISVGVHNGKMVNPFDSVQDVRNSLEDAKSEIREKGIRFEKLPEAVDECLTKLKDLDKSITGVENKINEIKKDMKTTAPAQPTKKTVSEHPKHLTWLKIFSFRRRVTK